MDTMKRYEFSPQARAALEDLRVPLAIYQKVGRNVNTLMVSDGFLEVFGFDSREKACLEMDRDMYAYTHPEDLSRVTEAAIRFTREEAPYDLYYRVRSRRGGEYRMIHSVGRHVTTETGDRLAQVWYTDEGSAPQEEDRDAGGKKAEGGHPQAGSLDHLTGLQTISGFLKTCEQRIEGMERDGVSPAILYIDLNGMKFYNRQFGFEGGDLLLRSFARLMIKYFGAENCSHVGQDHFAAVAAEEGLEKSLGEFFEEWRGTGAGRPPTVRVGIYPVRMERVRVSTACDRAKLACDLLKKHFTSAFRFFEQRMLEETDRKQYILSSFDRALRERWITVYYQPIVRALNGKVCDEEALARWIDPEKGMLSPAEFIPILEDAHLIYRLDLYVLERILEKLKLLREEGLHIVPQSINLSRSDFDSCDIVEEVRRRVDAAGIPHSRLTIEITESVIGSSFEEMQGHIARFREMGFPVWMDDFGSGYSSLDVLQSLKFDLLKFDMRFMQQMDNGNNGRILLTELMRMANALGVDTVCEGVETQEQVRFLQEIGCAKLQGYYFCRPIPVEKILERYMTGNQIGFENPSESGYFDRMGRVNLFDISMIAKDSEDSIGHYFNSMPMAILEIWGEGVRFVRSNESFRSFMLQFFGYDLMEEGVEYTAYPTGKGEQIMDGVRSCTESDEPALIEETMPDGTKVRAFAKRIATNPVYGTVAVAVGVLNMT